MLFTSLITKMFAQPSPPAGRGIELLSSDSRANLYAATHDSIRCLAARQSVVNSQEVRSTDAASLKVFKELKLLSPQLQSLTSFCVNRSGTHAVLAGASKQDSHYVAMVLVELAAYQSRKRNSRSSEVPSQTVHPSLFQARPGLVVWQAVSPILPF
ncbi:hypothetical protein ABBQ32_14202 [Trebouxia sp. C0010 RCD-2024]